MMYSEEMLSMTLDKIRCCEVVADLIPGSARGKNSTVCTCPFCGEKPLVALREEFLCARCGSAGDSVDFVMRNKNLSFNDAILYLYSRYDINLKHSIQVSLEDYESICKSIEDISRRLAAIRIAK